MNKLQCRLNDYFSDHNFLSGDDLQKIISDPLNARVLKELENSHCIRIYYSDDEIDGIAPGSEADLYLIERSELWLNRLVSFTAGIATTLIVQAVLSIF